MTKKQFIFVLIVTFIVVIIWVVADIIHTKPSIPLDPKLQNLLEPVTPTFDKSVLDDIEKNELPLFIETGATQEASAPTVVRR